MRTSPEIETIFENEWFAVRHSGEIPEIALYSAYYYLSEDEAGPKLDLSDEWSRKLVEAAGMRFREIVLRDLNHANRETSVYRGIKRSIANWKRFEMFCHRQGVDPTTLRHETAAALVAFISEELVDIERTGRAPSINCSYPELTHFAGLLGLDCSVLPDSLRLLCCERQD